MPRCWKELKVDLLATSYPTPTVTVFAYTMLELVYNTRRQQPQQQIDTRQSIRIGEYSDGVLTHTIHLDAETATL